MPILPLILTLVLIFSPIGVSATTTATSTEATIARIQRQLLAITTSLTRLMEALTKLKDYDKQYGTNKYGDFVSGRSSSGSSGSSRGGQSSNPLSDLFSSLSQMLGGLSRLTGGGPRVGGQPGVPPAPLVSPNVPGYSPGQFYPPNSFTASAFLDRAEAAGLFNGAGKVVPIDPNSPHWISVGTSYYPDSTRAIEGGAKDGYGGRIWTLHDDFLAVPRKSLYVTVAMDKNLQDSGELPPGTVLRIPELEDTYNQKKCIPFVVLDYGRAFLGKGYSKIDIAWTRVEPTLNKPGEISRPFEVYRQGCASNEAS